MSVNTKLSRTSGALILGTGIVYRHVTQEDAISAAIKVADEMFNANLATTLRGVVTNTQSISHSVTWHPIDLWCASVIVSGVAA